METEYKDEILHQSEGAASNSSTHGQTQAAPVEQGTPPEAVQGGANTL